MELETKILDYLNKNIDGIKISEMEIPLCEKRMKLGFIVKALVDEEKILKISDKYYPKKCSRNLNYNRLQLIISLNNQLLIN